MNIPYHTFCFLKKEKPPYFYSVHAVKFVLHYTHGKPIAAPK